jgi:hypothetical protein
MAYYFAGHDGSVRLSPRSKRRRSNSIQSSINDVLDRLDLAWLGRLGSNHRHSTGLTLARRLTHDR